MTFKERVASWFRAGMPDDFEPDTVATLADPPPAPDPPPPPQETPKVSTADSKDEEVTRLRAELKAVKDRRKADISTHARAFVQAHSAHILPAEAPFLAWVYAQLATADEEQTMPEGGFRVEGHAEPFQSRTEVLHHAISLRPDISRSQERVVTDQTLSGLQVVDNGSKGSDPAQDAYAQGKAYAERANRRRA